MFLEDPPFPGCPSFGFTSEPMYSVTSVKTAGGHETRNRNWSRPLHRFTCTVTRNQRDISELLEFWHAMGGAYAGFRFKDWADYKSCRIEEEYAATDSPLIAIADSSGLYQLTKIYEFGVLFQLREITKPVVGRIVIADNGVEKTETVDWELDYATGHVTLLFSPVGELTWGGEFDVPCRFASEFPIEIANLRVQSVSLVLEEIRPTAEEVIS